MNNLTLSGVVIGLEAIRYTPAGIPLLSFVLQHISEQTEAGLKRKVECEVNAVAIGDIAKSSIQIGDNIKAKGFLAKRSAKSTQLVFHIDKLEKI
ncbi:MAG TPA: primosomal replication protein N [Methylotenera sp.]|nr:primosomal replication protein N [Methylotenera sp.]